MDGPKTVSSKEFLNQQCNSLGHASVLHSSVDEAGPRLLQSSPPLEGGGLVQVLVLVCTPPPQVFEHAP